MKLVIFLFCAIFVCVQCDQATVFDQKFLPLLRFGRELIFQFAKSPTFALSYNYNLRRGKVQQPFNESTPFFCDVSGPGSRSKTPPKSVHKLTPGDIDIVAAIGDSLTAANGVWAVDVLQVLIEGKGVSFSIGGQGTWREFLTLPNILKEYNPKLYGFSDMDTLSYKKAAKFNVAEPGAMSSDTVHQARNLFKRMNSDKNVDMKNHWKLITYFIGGNDFCLDTCYYDQQDRLVDNMEYDLTKALRIIRDYIPRAMVNVVMAPDVVHLLQSQKNKPFECITLHYLECPCVFALNQQKNMKRHSKTIQKWKDRVAEVVIRKEFHDKPDFTVNLAPFVDKLDLMKDRNGNTDFSYLSYDCFHLSQKGNSIAANALWNNMMEPAGNKSRTWKKEFTEFKCPTVDHPYLSTSKNS